MNKFEAIQKLNQLGKKGRFVFNISELHKIFPEDKPKALQEGLARLVKSKILRSACRGVYVNEHANSFDAAYVIEHIVRVLRKGEYNYVSLESALSEYGLISQIPIDRLTVMTTGRAGSYKTPYGIIEFTHTKRSVNDILKHIITMPNRPLRIATEQAALRDLKRVGRNLHLLH